jgi:hypothetical protein
MCVISPLRTAALPLEDGQAVIPVLEGTGRLGFYKTAFQVGQIAGLTISKKLVRQLPPPDPWEVRVVDFRDGKPVLASRFWPFPGPLDLWLRGGIYTPGALRYLEYMNKMWALTSSGYLPIVYVPTDVPLWDMPPQSAATLMEKAADLVGGEWLVEAVVTEAYMSLQPDTGGVSFWVRLAFLEGDEYIEFVALNKRMEPHRYLGLDRAWVLLDAAVREDLEEEIDDRSQVWPMNLQLSPSYAANTLVRAVIVGGVVALVFSTPGLPDELLLLSVAQ